MEDKNNSYILKKEKNKSKKRVYETHINKNITNEKFIDNSYSNKTNNIINIHCFDELSLNENIKRNKNVVILNTKYKKDLFEKFSEFLNKNKFKLSNNFDEKHSKKFLDKKDKCLERIIISDIIENEESKDNSVDKNFKRRKTYGNKKSCEKYFIVISNYDEEIKFKNTPKKRSVNMEKIIKNIEKSYLSNKLNAFYELLFL